MWAADPSGLRTPTWIRILDTVTNQAKHSWLGPPAAAVATSNN